MRAVSIAVLVATMLPAVALAGPDGAFTVKGVNPDGTTEYTGKVKVERQNQVYRVTWTIAGEETIGIGLGVQMIGGRMVAGAASDQDTGIAISYISNETAGNATYTEFPDGAWRGVWAFDGTDTVSIEEWIPADRPLKKQPPATADESQTSVSSSEQIKLDEIKTTPTRVIPSPVPMNASPK
jgi:hypothetical protein